MQQRYLYMKPALQPGEAVLLPALPRRYWTEPLVSEPTPAPVNEAFVPVTGEWNGQTTALSTQVRSVGSMAGRGVLRAAGVSVSPYRAPAAQCRSNAGKRRLGRR